MASLNPWQLLAWIAALELISVPLIIFTVNAITIGKYKAQEQHQAKMIGTAGKVFETFGKELAAKLEGIVKVNTNNKEEASDEH